MKGEVQRGGRVELVHPRRRLQTGDALVHTNALPTSRRSPQAMRLRNTTIPQLMVVLLHGARRDHVRFGERLGGRLL